MSLDLSHLKSLEAAATKGPWRHSEGFYRIYGAWTQQTLREPQVGNEIYDADAKLICALRNAAPALIARIEQLEADIRRVTSDNSQLRLDEQRTAIRNEQLEADNARLRGELEKLKDIVDARIDRKIDATEDARDYSVRKREATVIRDAFATWSKTRGSTSDAGRVEWPRVIGDDEIFRVYFQTGEGQLYIDGHFHGETEISIATIEQYGYRELHGPERIAALKRCGLDAHSQKIAGGGE